MADTPGTAQAESKHIGPYFEGHPSEIRLSCSTSDPGNPVAMFKWSKDKISEGETNQNYYIISSGQLSVSGHDGVWQCMPYNRIGEGQPDTINITVYGKLFSKKFTLWHILCILYCTVICCNDTGIMLSFISSTSETNVYRQHIQSITKSRDTE